MPPFHGWSTDVFVGMVSLPGNRLATATSSGVVSVWDADSWRCVASYRGPQRTSALAALPDGRLAIGSRKPSGMNITIWDPSGGAFCWSAQDDPFATTSDAKVQYLTSRVVLALAACADGRLACSCCGHPSRFDVQVWDLGTSTCVSATSIPGSHGPPLLQLRGGRLCTFGYDAHVLEQGSLSIIATIPDPGRQLRRVAAELADGRIAIAKGDGIALWDVATNTLTQARSDRDHKIASMAVLPDGRLVTGGADATVKVWNLAAGSCEMTLAGHDGSVAMLAVLSDGCLVAGSGGLNYGTISASALTVWDLHAQACMATLRPRTDYVYSLEPVPPTSDGSAVESRVTPTAGAAGALASAGCS